MILSENRYPLFRIMRLTSFLGVGLELGLQGRELRERRIRIRHLLAAFARRRSLRLVVLPGLMRPIAAAIGAIAVLPGAPIRAAALVAVMMPRTALLVLCRRVLGRCCGCVRGHARIGRDRGRAF